MNLDKLKIKVQKEFPGLALALQQHIFAFVVAVTKRMAIKNNELGQKIVYNNRGYAEYLNKKNQQIEELSKELYREKTESVEVIRCLRGSMKSQTETIVALRDENENLRNALNNTSEDRLIKIVKLRDERIAELESKLKSSEDYITKVPPGFYDIIKTINENEKLKKCVGHATDRIIEFELKVEQLTNKIEDLEGKNRKLNIKNSVAEMMHAVISAAESLKPKAIVGEKGLEIRDVVINNLNHRIKELEKEIEILQGTLKTRTMNDDSRIRIKDLERSYSLLHKEYKEVKEQNLTLNLKLNQILDILK